jgi:hypothetical protein
MKLRFLSMKRVAVVLVPGLLSVTLIEAQPFPTNIIQQAQAIKIASGLRQMMLERDVTTFLESRGLKCNLERAGGWSHWLNSCTLTG